MFAPQTKGKNPGPLQGLKKDVLPLRLGKPVTGKKKTGSKGSSKGSSGIPFGGGSRGTSGVPSFSSYTVPTEGNLTPGQIAQINQQFAKRSNLTNPLAPWSGSTPPISQIDPMLNLYDKVPNTSGRVNPRARDRRSQRWRGRQALANPRARGGAGSLAESKRSLPVGTRLV